MKFKGYYSFLSNFYETRIEYHGLSYPTTEHAYQAHKSIHPSDHKFVSELATPRLAKMRGKELGLREGWDEVKISIMNDLLPSSSNNLRSLDVSILHSLILDKMLGIDKEKLKQGTMKGGGFVVYLKGIGDAIEESIKSVKGDAQAVFFMNPTKVEEVEQVSKNFECMPQKSTFFQPKVWTGLTINKLR